MQVSQFPIDPGPAAWNELLDSEPVRPQLDTQLTADVVIVGAGFAGLSAARRLVELEPSASVIVLEARRVAEGPAGRNSGFMIDVPHDLASSDYGGGSTEHDHHEIQVNRAGIDYALDAKQTFGMTDEALTQSGKINGAITSRGVQHNQAYAAYLDQLNEPYERLNANAMRSITGSEAYIDGLFSPGTAMIQPALYIRNLANGVERQGVKLFENSAVCEIEKKGNHWQVLTSAGSVSAAKVLLTVNGHLESFGYFKRKLVHVYTYASMTRRLNAQENKLLGGDPRWALTPADPLGTTVRKISGTGGDRIIIRNRATYDPTLSVDNKRISAVSTTHDHSFEHRFPQLSAVSMEYRWGGRLCLSLNAVPVFGEIDSNLYAACCQNGLGTAKGTAYGKLIADYLNDESNPLIEKVLAQSPPKALPPSPIASLGANMKLRWSEFRAGREL